ncbi:hypothetical protein GF420_02710 [candidate division GN15 bacterium]|nr:hypothetical protein [candidate division GN15 bacterium]
MPYDPDRMEDPREVMQALREETVKYRDEVYEMNGTVLTVEDTRTALEAFDQYARGFEITIALTYYQRKLLYRYIRRVRPGKYR